MERNNISSMQMRGKWSNEDIPREIRLQLRGSSQNGFECLATGGLASRRGAGVAAVIASARLGASAAVTHVNTQFHGVFPLNSRPSRYTAGGSLHDLHRGCPFHVPRGCFTVLPAAFAAGLVGTGNNGCSAAKV